MASPGSVLLVLEHGRVCDALDALAVTQALQRARPELPVTVLAPRPAADLLTREASVAGVLVLDEPQRDLLEMMTEGSWELAIGLYRSESTREIMESWADRTLRATVIHPRPDQEHEQQDLAVGLLDELVGAGLIGREHVHAPMLTAPSHTAIEKAESAWKDARPRILVTCECETALITELSPSPLDEVREALDEAYGGKSLRMVTRLATSGAAWLGNRQKPIAADAICNTMAAADLVILVGTHSPEHDDDLARLTAALGAPMIALPAPSRWSRYVPSPSQRAPVRELEHLTLGTPTGVRPEELVDMAIRLAGAALTPARTPKLRQQPEPDAERVTRGRRRAGDGAVERPSALRKAHRVLVVRPDNMGDVILAGPAIRTLRENMPHVQISLLSSPAGAQAATLLPWLDDVVIQRTVWQDLAGGMPQEPSREWSFIKELAGRNYDAAVILTSFSQTPQPAALVAALAGIPLRIGEGKEDSEELVTLPVAPPPDALHQAERSLRLLAEAGLTLGSSDLEIRIPAAADAAAARVLAENGLPERDFVVMSPWSSCAARDFSPQRMVEAGEAIAAASGRQAILAGRSQDRERGEAPVLPPGVTDLIDKTTVPELAAIVARAGLVLSANSLSMHLADALDVPVVVTYTGTEYVSQWSPRRCPHRVLWRAVGCRPCYRFVSAYHHECADIPVEEIVQAGRELLDEVAQVRAASDSAAPATR